LKIRLNIFIECQFIPFQPIFLILDDISLRLIEQLLQKLLKLLLLQSLSTAAGRNHKALVDRFLVLAVLVHLVDEGMDILGVIKGYEIVGV
jgi:hypothetical protein